MSSASRTGLYNGRMRALTAMGTDVVRAASAAAIGNGLGRYPSSAAWCSDTTSRIRPRDSAHAAMSSAAGYSDDAGAPPAGARMSNRRVNTKS